MRAKLNSLLFVLHFALLILAATKLTAITWFWNGNWSCNFYSYRYAHGWGSRFVSEYSLQQVLLYVAAYSCGLAAFWMLRKRLPIVCGLGALACLLGVVSFSVELTHWLWNHNYSLIVSAPALMVILWNWLIAQLAITASRLRLVQAA